MQKIKFIILILIATSFKLNSMVEYRWIEGELSPEIIQNIFTENPDLESFYMSRDYTGVYERGQKYISPSSEKYDDPGECILALAKCLKENVNLKKLTIKIHSIKKDIIWLKLFESLKASNVKDLTLKIGDFYSHENCFTVWFVFFETLPELELEILDLSNTDLAFLLKRDIFIPYHKIKKTFFKYLRSDACSIQHLYFPGYCLNSFLRYCGDRILIEKLIPTIHTERRYDKDEIYYMKKDYENKKRKLRSMALPHPIYGYPGFN